MVETTVCLLTPPGKGGIAVIELAGPKAPSMLETTFRPLPSHAKKTGNRQQATGNKQQATGNRQQAAGDGGRLQLGHLLGEDGQTLDEAIVETRDGRVYINIHGGPWVTQAVLGLLERQGARRLPRPVGPVFPAGHPHWDNPAIGAEMLGLVRSLQSPLAVAAVGHQWSDGLSKLVSETMSAASGGAAPPTDALRQAAGGLGAMRRLIEPAEVVLAGPPNAGKSTLANLLAGVPMSIVHETPGTTRDWVRQLALVRGVPIWLTDTAGIWEFPIASPASAVDAEAVRRARQRLTHADVIVLLGPAGAGLLEEAAASGKSLLRVWSKSDLSSAAGGAYGLAVSAVRGEGIDELRGLILDRLGLADFDAFTPMAFTDRQADLLERSAQALDIGDKAQGVTLLTDILRGQLWMQVR